MDTYGPEKSGTMERLMARPKEGVKLLLRELILENFMTYKYARIPVSSGLNLILGPNGAGKSSILLALSVALGQAHTERSRKLSDLIRWGEDIARITLIFDNRPFEGKRPIPEVRSDELVITRYLRKDGEYWHQINFRPATKLELVDILNRFGIDPDNMLIIMQQYVVEQIVKLSPQELLQMIEKAVGLFNFRERMQQSKEKLQFVASEEKAVSALLSEAKATLETWANEVEKLKKRDSLRIRLTELEIELAWSSYLQLNASLESLMKKQQTIEDRILKHNGRIQKASQMAGKIKQTLESKRKRLAELYVSLGAAGQNTHDEIGVQISDTDKDVTNLIEEYASMRSREAVLERGKELLERFLQRLQTKAEELEKKVTEASSRAKQSGPQPLVVRPTDEIGMDKESSQIQLASIGPVVENAEEIYEGYRNTYEEIQKKTEVVKGNKEAALKEMNDMISVWKQQVLLLADMLSTSFQDKMSSIDAQGQVSFINQDDVDQAGISIKVSFGGSPITELNYFTQSGGERSAAIISFLLSLQSVIPSPIRGLDEFDVHMDPKNRETFFKLLEHEAMQNPEILYLVITPGQVPVVVKSAIGIVVQKVSGESVINVVENA